jgi:antitoxin ParD1/3/4
MDISISLPPELVDLVKAKVASGRYSSASEVVGEALRLLERIDPHEGDDIEVLRRAWRRGIESGDGGPLDFAEMRAAAQRELAERRKK